MFNSATRFITADPVFRNILLFGLILQLITSITAIGVSSADQHFQIVEFSMYQLGKPNGAIQVWEINNFVRPTLQVYLFSAYHLGCNLAGISDPYTQLTLLRIMLGLLMFCVFNLMAMHYFRDQKRTLMYVLLLVNFSWALPYSRTLFSSEMMSSLFFFGTLLLYEYKKDKDPSFILLLLIGFLFSLSFYFRFQIAFSMAGLAVWLLFFEKRYKHAAPLLAGFAAGTAMNVVLDYGFYKEWVFTPYSYFYANIIDGRADYFGRSSFLRYIGLILLVAPAPLFSFVLFYYMLKNSVRYYTNPVIISVVLFVIFHSIVGHKEERFLFPVFNVFPLLIGWSILEVQKILTSSRYVLRNIARFLLWSTIVLNTVLLIVMTTVPFSQTILFSKKLSNRFKGEQAMIYCIGQSPFETPSGNQMEFYKIASRNISVRKIKIFNAAILMREQPEFIATPYNSVKEHFANLDNLGYKPVLASSSFLWKLNELLDRNEMTTINEIWMLYQKQ